MAVAANTYNMIDAPFKISGGWWFGLQIMALTSELYYNYLMYMLFVWNVFVTLFITISYRFGLHISCGGHTLFIYISNTLNAWIFNGFSCKIHALLSLRRPVLTFILKSYTIHVGTVNEN